jgi:hypothetical protein
VFEGSRLSSSAAAFWTSSARPDQLIRKADRIKGIFTAKNREHKIFCRKEALEAQNKSGGFLFAL